MFQIAIVGRPNVGKSTLFNRLCGKRKAIVGDEPGITRDRVYGSMRWNGKCIDVLDTGGLIPRAKDVIPKEVLLQVESAISESQLVLMVGWQSGYYRSRRAAASYDAKNGEAHFHGSQ